MAGTQYSGFANSKADLFQGAPMVVIPRERDDILLLDRVKKLLTPAGFSHMTVTTAEHHDAMIAYTSQMCHVLSNAYVKSPRAQMHKGYSAGSYRDLTRVAWLNPAMWAELFLENRENLLFELDTLIRSLEQYREAIQEDDLPPSASCWRRAGESRRRWTGHDHRHGKASRLRGYRIGRGLLTLWAGRPPDSGRVGPPLSSLILRWRPST